MGSGGRYTVIASLSRLALRALQPTMASVTGTTLQFHAVVLDPSGNAIHAEVRLPRGGPAGILR